LHFKIDSIRTLCSSHAPTPRSNGGTTSPSGLWLHPCNMHLSLSSRGAQLAIFCSKVDEISLLIVNTTTNPSV
ncbi:unnamed protein product, partial [Musa acuminata subsp. burmannicoides]